MASQPIFEKPHRRFNPLNGEYVLVSPQRVSRPWQGQVEKAQVDQRPSHDPDCYLCPGNSRAGGDVNPDYCSTFVFTNDFPSLLEQEEIGFQGISSLILAQPTSGTNRVICYSPRHDQTLSLMSVQELGAVVDTWCAQTEELGRRYLWVQVFQNQGEMMGASNPHPHGQVWAINALPNEPKKEDQQQRQYLSKTGRSLLLDYLQQEIDLKERIVIDSAYWVVVVPFWAIWPFETLLMPKRQVLRMNDLQTEERGDLADLLKCLMCKYDNLFESSFPYSMGWHGAPFTKNNNNHWQLHAHIFPPLLRSATIRKFMVGYEMLAEAQRDMMAEEAAQRLRKSPVIHYSQKRI